MRIILALIPVLLVGCSWFNDDKGFFVNRTDDYLDSVESVGLLIPEDLDSQRVEDPFPIPPTPDQINAEYFPGRPPRPDALFASDNRDEVRIQSLGERRWLVVPEPPNRVWPKVKQFFSENGVSIVAENPTYGRIDTDWLEIEDKEYRDVVRADLRDARKEAGLTVGRDRIRLRVEQGLRERSSEVHLRHENDAVFVPREQVVDLNTLISEIPTVELKMLNEIGAYIAAKVSEQTVSMIAQDISTGVKSVLARDERGDPILRLNLDYDRAWATVGQALSRAEVDVISLDQVEGVYYVSIPDSLFTGREPSWLSNLNPFGGGKGTHELQLHVTAMSESAFQVAVFDAEANRIDRDLSQQVLSMLREFAS